MGPLEGCRIVELAGIGPAPFCAMLLADMGADVVRVDRPSRGGDLDLGIPLPRRYSVLLRSRRSARVDLKDPAGVDVVLGLVESADALIEGFRPGVAERLGLGPDVCLARNPRLVYGRMTGWGQDGPLAPAAGHDINYVALAGALHSIGPAGGPPTVPLNLVGDFGGGGAYLAMGVLAGIIEARTSGHGQVVDAAMVEGAASLMASAYGMYAAGIHSDERGANLIDGGAYYYGTYETADGGWVAIGSIERRFYDQLLEVLGIGADELPDRDDRSRWPERRQRLAEVFRTRTRDEWTKLMEGTDVCFAPVLTLGEAPEHEHNRARGTFVEVDGVVQPGPAPRFSRTPSEIQGPPCSPGAHTAEVLADWGIATDEIDRLMEQGTVA